MKKLLCFLLMLFCITCLTACGKQTEESVLEKLSNKIENTDGYKLEAEMELINNEDSYKYDVTVSYAKDDYFRVSLRNQSNNHEQIILKNTDGVYVLTPTLNKSFKFQSQWPYNNSQSYLYQSILEDMKNDDELTMVKDGDNYVFTSSVNYKNNASLVYQEVVVDKNYNIKKVTVYDENENAQIKVSFKSIDMNAKFDDDYFVLEQNMEAVASSDEVSEDTTELQEAVYPMYLPDGTYLETEKTVDLDEGSRIILTFSGDASFMLVEELAVKEDEMAVIPTSGDLEILGDSIAIIDDTSVSFISEGVEYYLVSSNMTSEELVNVAKSISVMPVNK